MLRTLPTPNIFSQGCPLNDRRRAARTICKIGRLYFLLLLSCLFLLRHLNLFHLMSGNVHSNFVLSYPLLCAPAMSLQCCTCSKWAHLSCAFHLQSLIPFSALSVGAVLPVAPQLLGVPSPTLSSFLEHFSACISIGPNNSPHHPFAFAALFLRPRYIPLTSFLSLLHFWLFYALCFLFLS